LGTGFEKLGGKNRGVQESNGFAPRRSRQCGPTKWEIVFVKVAAKNEARQIPGKCGQSQLKSPERVKGIRNKLREKKGSGPQPEGGGGSW